MIKKIENIVLGITFGAIPIIICFLAGWWISLPFVQESYVILYSLGGILLGVIIDVIFLKGWIQSAYSMKPLLWMGIYIFYSVMEFGFFMGFPVFNAALVLPAGIFTGRWLVHINADSGCIKKVTRQAALFTTSVLAVVCTLSAALALLSPSTPSDIQGMLRLPFQVTTVILISIIVGGGITLLVIGWWLTIKSIEKTYSFSLSYGVTSRLGN
jgi:hypothetical protein